MGLGMMPVRGAMKATIAVRRGRRYAVSAQMSFATFIELKTVVLTPYKQKRNFGF
jgi:hypothetical protein